MYAQNGLINLSFYDYEKGITSASSVLLYSLKRYRMKDYTRLLSDMENIATCKSNLHNNVATNNVRVGKFLMDLCHTHVECIKKSTASGRIYGKSFTKQRKKTLRLFTLAQLKIKITLSLKTNKKNCFRF